MAFDLSILSDVSLVVDLLYATCGVLVHNGKQKVKTREDDERGRGGEKRPKLEQCHWKRVIETKTTLFLDSSNCLLLRVKEKELPG